MALSKEKQGEILLYKPKGWQNLNALELSDRKSMTERYLRPALTAGLIEMTIHGKPNSRNQKADSTHKCN